MKINAQGLFGKLPISEEYLLLGLPGWAVDQAWRVLDTLTVAVHRYAIACPTQRSIIYGLCWPSQDALGRESLCSLAAVEKGRAGFPDPLWQHPWFADADVKQKHCAQLPMRDLIRLVTRWAGALRLGTLSRCAWGKKEIVIAVDGGPWKSAVC